MAEPSRPTAEWLEKAGEPSLVLAGDWTTEELRQQRMARDVPATIAGRAVVVEFANIGRLDANAALFLTEWLKAIDGQAASLSIANAPPFFERIATESAKPGTLPELPQKRVVDLARFFERIGQRTESAVSIVADLFAFQGQISVGLVKAFSHPKALRGRSVVYHMKAAGVSALPIVGLLSFLLGVVTAYQGADQLARFGAQIFTVNVVGIGVLREMGALITAIVVAGRSASAFAAQIGTMKINEEVDALRVIGLDPVQVLVIPRVLALALMFPFMVVFADLMGVLGGAIMATFALDISISQFIRQFHAEVPLYHFWVGLAKAPLFASAIAAIGCQQGLRVGQGAAAVGERTTAAVVQAIFFVIVIDAGMSIFFSMIGV